jgi:hypothetical protein
MFDHFILLISTALLTKKLKRERRTARRLQEQLEHTGTRPQPLIQSRPLTHHSEHAQSGEDEFKQAQEDLKKLNGTFYHCHFLIWEDNNSIF